MIAGSTVLGIDPGSLITGWGLLGGSPSRPELIDCGVIRLERGQDLALRLGQLQAEISTLVRRYRPDSAGVEAPFQGAGARSALQLAHARGVILAALAVESVPVSEYTPAMVKKSVTGNGRADKHQVRTMVVQLVGREAARGTHDLSDALAVGLCHLVANRSSRLIAQARQANPTP
ncbi:MAG: crossover junction endodeoxyribonuclease RuvC [bacterium]|nr:crossover junction endodeoxyribonuclease RuvC [bacterium]